MSGQQDAAGGENAAVKPEGGACGSVCGCGARVSGKRGKGFLGGVMALAACAVTAALISGSQEEVPVAVSATDTTWGTLLKGLSELDAGATNTEAFFVVIPSDDAARTDAVQKEVTAATSSLAERGMRTAKFLLSREAEDYQRIAGMTGAPAVLVKGKVTRDVADKDITKDSLLQVFASVSRTSRVGRRKSVCGAGGCGPKGCGTAAPQGYDLDLPKR